MKYFKIAICIIIGIYLLFNTCFRINPQLAGDGIEYVLMTGSFYHHGTPDMRAEDLDAFKKSYNQHHKLEGYTKDWVDFQTNFVRNTYNPSEVRWGYATALNDKKYSQHFWLYPLINLPVWTAIELIGKDSLKAFQITNTLLILLVVVYLLFYAKISEIRKVVLAVTFVFSSVFWYITWPHPEVFAATGVLLALVFYFEKKYYAGIFLAALATTHNPPIVLLLLFIAGKCLIEKGFNIKNLGNIFIYAFVCTIPTLFYYYNFHLPNLIIEADALKTKFYTFTRFWSFFFDLNQGLILSIPLIMILFLAVYFRRLFKPLKQLNYDMLLLPVIIGMTLIFMSMSNWNMGEAVVTRYAVWVSMLIIGYTIMTFSLEKVYQKTILFTSVIIQPFVVLIYGGFEVPVWKYLNHYPIAEWVLIHHPSWYNPDPEIFGERTLQIEGLTEKDSIIAYRAPSGELTKLMIHKNALQNLNKEMISAKDTIGLSFINDWAYINKKQ